MISLPWPGFNPWSGNWDPASQQNQGKRQPNLQQCNRANPRRESQQQKAALTPSTVRLPFLRTCLNLGEAWTKHSSTKLNQAQFGAQTKPNWTKHISVKLEPSTVQPNRTKHSSTKLNQAQFGAWVTSWSSVLGWLHLNLGEAWTKHSSTKPNQAQFGCCF